MTSVIDVIINYHKEAQNLHQKYISHLTDLINATTHDQQQTTIPPNVLNPIPSSAYADVEMIDEFSGQNAIWERIQNAHKNAKQDNIVDRDDQPPENTTVDDSTLITGDIADAAKANTSVEVDLDFNKKKMPIVTKLSRYSGKQQKKILKDIHAKAIKNINHLTGLDDLSGKDEMVCLEADRILAVWLKTN
jgi:hypothetical protein